MWAVFDCQYFSGRVRYLTANISQVGCVAPPPKVLLLSQKLQKTYQKCTKFNQTHTALVLVAFGERMLNLPHCTYIFLCVCVCVCVCFMVFSLLCFFASSV